MPISSWTPSPLASTSLKISPARSPQARPNGSRSDLTGDLEGKGEVDCQLLELREAARGAAMAGRHVGLEQDQVVAGVVGPQARDPLGGLPVGYAPVGEPRIGKDVRIGPRRH